MQTLEINYKSVFDSLPGLNLLLLPDSPAFTVIALSDAYTDVASLTRDQAIGRSVFTLLMPGTAKRLVESKLTAALQHVVVFKEPSAATLVSATRTGHEAALKQYRYACTPVFSGEADVQYIILTITELENKDPAVPPQARVNEAEFIRDPRFRHMIMQMPVAVGILRGKEMVLELANAPMLELWGKDSEIVGKPIVEGLPEIIDQPFPGLLREVYATGMEVQGFETEAHLVREGKPAVCYFNFVYAPLKDDAGNVTGILMVGADVTNLVKAKKEKEESEKRYRDLIANATVATAIYEGEDMVISLANEAMLKLWGKDASVIGKKLRDAIPELDGQPFHDLLKKVYTTGVTYHSREDKADFEVDGRLQSFYFNFTYKALRDSRGRVYAILNMAVDVSDTVKAKIDINNAEERWRMALQSAELGTWDFYPLTGEFSCSVRMKELFGLPGYANPGFDVLLNAIHPRDRNRVRDEMRESLKPGSTGSYRMEYCVIGVEDKLERWIRATGRALYDESGNAYRLTGTVLDITDAKRAAEALEERVQRRTQELLLLNRELERSNQELEQYAYVASHDLQEPLRKILVYTDLIKEGSIRMLPNEHARLEKIIASARRMSHLIQDLLNFSKLLKTENIFSTVDLNVVIRNVIDDFELKIQETGAIIKVEPLPVIEASPQQMNQLFYNLLSNALKFRKEHATPEVRIAAFPLEKTEVERYGELNPELTYFDIKVSDNGIGFNTKYANQVFEIFKRLQTRRYEGTGIGLALCRKIARNHRGDIYASSREGEGSAFHVLLPQKQARS